MRKMRPPDPVLMSECWTVTSGLPLDPPKLIFRPKQFVDGEIDDLSWRGISLRPIAEPEGLVPLEMQELECTGLKPGSKIVLIGDLIGFSLYSKKGWDVVMQRVNEYQLP